MADSPNCGEWKARSRCARKNLSGRFVMSSCLKIPKNVYLNIYSLYFHCISVLFFVKCTYLKIYDQYL